MPNKKILITIMNYGTEDEIIGYAEELTKQTVSEELFLMVVDNKYDSSKSLEDKLKNIKIDSYYYNQGKNLGYLNGALFGADKFKELYDYMPQWIVVSNTDIIYPESNFYEKFLSYKYEEDVWCVAPSVVAPNGRYCNPHYPVRIPLSKVNRLITIFSHPVLMRPYYWLSNLKADMKAGNKKLPGQFVYSSHGCYFILSKAFYDKLNGEKYGVLLYSEESFIAEFIYENGKKSFYDDRLEVFHNENLVTGKLNYKVKGKYIAESMKYIKDRFYVRKGK